MFYTFWRKELPARPLVLAFAAAVVLLAPPFTPVLLRD